MRSETTSVMEQDMSRMINVFKRIPGMQVENDFFPSCEVSEKKDFYMVSIDLPGIPKNEIKVDLIEGKLHIYGERKSDHKEGNYSERLYGKFERTMSLPSNVSINNALATFDNGVLTVSLKKTEEPKIKRLEIGNKKLSKNNKFDQTAYAKQKG